eukprot:13782195-Alexandrium_andersonii.AAC.2
MRANSLQLFAAASSGFEDCPRGGGGMPPERKRGKQLEATQKCTSAALMYCCPFGVGREVIDYMS